MQTELSFILSDVFSDNPSEVFIISYDYNNIYYLCPAGNRYDIALVLLPYKVLLDKYVNVACMPSSPVPVGASCVAAGWGLDESGSKLSFHILYLGSSVGSLVLHTKHKHG